MRRATYVGPDGLPMPLRHSPAEVVQIEYNSVGYETRHRYLDLEGNPAPGADDAFGQEMKYDDKGREIRETSLDAAGHYVNDSSGNATQLEEYDTDGNVVVWRALDASDQPTLLITGGYAIQRLQYHCWGNWTDWAYFDVDGAPVIATDDGAHKTSAAHDDQGTLTNSATLILAINRWTSRERSVTTWIKGNMTAIIDWCARPISTPRTGRCAEFRGIRYPIWIRLEYLVTTTPLKSASTTERDSRRMMRMVSTLYGESMTRQAAKRMSRTMDSIPDSSLP